MDTIVVLSAAQLVAEGLRRLIHTRGCSVVIAGSAAEAFDYLSSRGASPHIVIIDVEGIDDLRSVLPRMRELVSDLKVLLLAQSVCDLCVELAMSSAIDGVLLKRLSPEALRQCLKMVALGERIFPADFIDALSRATPAAVAARSVAAIPSAAPPTRTPETLLPTGKLSEREQEVLQCLAQGCSNKRIANSLNIAEATVKVHLKTLLKKIDVTNRTQAAIWAVRHGLSQNS
jgi:two-component system, NarL family, nitrate/nitrite response regulator NarL